MKTMVLLAAVALGGVLSACQPQAQQAPAADIQPLAATEAVSPAEAAPAADAAVVVASQKVQPTVGSKGPGATAPKPPPPPPTTPRPTISASVYSNAAS